MSHVEKGFRREANRDRLGLKTQAIPRKRHQWRWSGGHIVSRDGLGVGLTPEHESSRILNGIADEPIRCCFRLASPPGPLSIQNGEGEKGRKSPSLARLERGI